MKTILLTISVAILILLVLACGASEPATKTITWEYLEGSVMQISVPLDWEWDEEFNEEAAIEAESKGYEIPARAIRKPATSGFSNTLIQYQPGPIDDVIEISKELLTERGLDFEFWDGDVNDVPAVFERVEFQGDENNGDHTVIPAYIQMGDTGYRWVTCGAAPENTQVCEDLVNSVKIN